MSIPKHFESIRFGFVFVVSSNYLGFHVISNQNTSGRKLKESFPAIEIHVVYRQSTESITWHIVSLRVYNYPRNSVVIMQNPP